MPNNIFEMNAVHLQSGPLTEDATALHAPGTLGARFTLQNPTNRASSTNVPRAKRFQLVLVDSAAAAAPKAFQPAYWSDRSLYKVTTAGGTALNQVCGVFNNAPTRGNYTCIQIGGPCQVRASDAHVAAAVAGTDTVLGGATDLGVLLAGGTAPTTQPLGVIASPKTTVTTGGTGNHTVLVDLDLPEVV